MMCNRRSRTIICLFLSGIMVIMCLPYLIMKILDTRFASFPHKVTAADYHMETSADDVTYVAHIISTYMEYAESTKETVLISFDGGTALYKDECQDMAYAALLELTKKGVINPLWISEELPDFMEGDSFAIREYNSKDDEAGEPGEISYSILVWNSGDKYLKLMFDQKYKKILRIIYKGEGQIFAANDMEKLCNSFAAYQGLDILEDWSFNGKRLISQKAELSIECSQDDKSEVLQITPKELILMGY